jgi:hypothetical protein
MQKKEINNNDKNWQPASSNNSSSKEKSIEETRQEQTDPNLTELKGLTDPDEKLEPEGTDNDFSDTL